MGKNPKLCVAAYSAQTENVKKNMVFRSGVELEFANREKGPFGTEGWGHGSRPRVGWVGGSGDSDETVVSHSTNCSALNNTRACVQSPSAFTVHQCRRPASATLPG